MPQAPATQPQAQTPPIDPHALAALAQGAFAVQVHPDARPATRLTWDSREAGPDTAFVALGGEKMHGNQFVERALAAGAPFVLTDLDVPRAVRVPDAREALFAWARHERAKNPLVVGITGSAGKTTAKAYAAAALDAHSMPVFNTMPAIACFLIQYGASQQPLVVEMGIDRIGEMAELVDLVRPDVGVITSIGPTHLEYLGSVENIAREKGVILSDIHGQPIRSYVGQQAAPYYPANQYPSVQTYGFEMDGVRADLHGDHLQVTPEAARFEYGPTGKQHTVTLPHAARVQAEAAVLGLGLAEQLGLPLPEVIQRLTRAEVPAGRYRVHPGRFTVIDDAYNASPVAVRASLDALAEQPGRRISVLGKMLELGPTERDLHAEVGQYARQKADLTYGVGEYAAELGDHTFATVPELTAALLDTVQDGDVLLIKASRGISMTPEQRAAAGVGLDTVVAALLERQKH